MSKDAPRTFEALMSQLYAIPKDRHGRHRPDFVYRGLDVATWGLETSLQRLGPHYADVEEPLLRNFIKYSAEPGIASAPLLYKPAVAQHHDLKAYLERHPTLYRKIIVRKQLKWEIRDKLDQDQVNERMLFPSIDGTARWLKRYYGAGPKQARRARAAKGAKPKATAFTGPMTGTGT
jgi:hypothetical protein